MKTPRMPILFVGHGNPMNALADTPFTRTLRRIGLEFPRPRAVLVVSAHWGTEGTWLTGFEHPRTIHDFYGFPQALFDVRYPAPGHPGAVAEIQAGITSPRLNRDVEMWGLDHGTWSVFRHVYPSADVPIVQLSLDLSRAPEYHFDLGRQLSRFRSEGILIVGSGNLVHNLRKIDFRENAKPYEWALEFDQWIKSRLEARDFGAIMNAYDRTEAGKLSVPTLDHYLPVHYVLGASDVEDTLRFEFEEVHNASIAMRTFSFLPKSVA